MVKDMEKIYCRIMCTECEKTEKIWVSWKGYKRFSLGLKEDIYLGLKNVSMLASNDGSGVIHFLQIYDLEVEIPMWSLDFSQVRTVFCFVLL